jgi:hypothetical protein
MNHTHRDGGHPQPRPHGIRSQPEMTSVAHVELLIGGMEELVHLPDVRPAFAWPELAAVDGRRPARQ